MKLNKTHFEFFKKRCKFWIDYWGLKNWDIRYKFDRTEKEECAVTQSQLVDRLAWITLDNDADWEDSSERYLDRIAFHEIDEIRYARIECLAGMRFLDPGILREAIHELIVQEENVVFNVVSKNGLSHIKVV